MSLNRFLPKRGWAPRVMPKGPNGRNLCRWCSKEVPPRRQTFCSAECVDEWKMRTDVVYIRRKVFERDHGVCAICGLDTEALRKVLLTLWQTDPMAAHANAWIHGFGNAFQHVRLRWGRYPRPRSLWEADHIVAVVEDGGECGLEGLRTLCTPCHHLETARLMKRLRSRKSGSRIS